jgi:hypothetical protein
MPTKIPEKKEYAMKSKPVRFGRAIVLSTMFFLTVFSLFGGHDGAGSETRNMVHIWAGSLMLIGSAVHLATNLDWIRAVFSRPAHSFKKRVRRNRRTNLGLFISGLICTVAGLLWLLFPGATPNLLVRWSRLHTMSGIFMIVLMGIHLWSHRDWIVNTARQLRNQQSPKADEQITVRSEL